MSLEVKVTPAPEVRGYLVTCRFAFGTPRPGFPVPDITCYQRITGSSIEFPWDIVGALQTGFHHMIWEKIEERYAYPEDYRLLKRRARAMLAEFPEAAVRALEPFLGPWSTKAVPAERTPGR